MTKFNNPINNREFNFDSRLIAIESLKNCINKELFFTIIPSIQFYMFHTDEDGNPLTVTHDKSDEYDFGPWDLGVNLSEIYMKVLSFNTMAYVFSSNTLQMIFKLSLTSLCGNQPHLGPIS